MVVAASFSYKIGGGGDGGLILWFSYKIGGGGKDLATLLVARSTLQDKIAGRTPLGRKMGKDPYLSRDQEQQIAEYVFWKDLGTNRSYEL